MTRRTLTRTIHRARAFGITAPVALDAEALAQAQSVSQTTVTQHSVATPQPLSHSQSLANATLPQHGGLTPTNLGHGHTVSDAVSDIGWTSDIPTPLYLVRGTDYDLAPKLQGTPIGIADHVALPSGVSIVGPPNAPTWRLRADGGATIGTTNNNRLSVARTPAEADWLSRSTAPGVVWYHDFRNQAEVDRFRWVQGYGNDLAGTAYPYPGYGLTRNATDGPQGYCMEASRPPNGLDPPDWWRPFCPFTGATNGRGIDDPAAGGTIPLQSWNPTQGVDYSGTWNARNNRTWYGHQDYWSQSPTSYAGDEFYIQVRCLVNAARFQLVNDGGGKLIYVAQMAQSNQAQSTLLVSNQYKKTDVVAYPDFYSHTINTNPLWQNWGTSPANNTQPGGSQSAIYNTFDAPNYNSGFRFKPQEWAVVLLHFVPSHNYATNQVADGRLQAWYWRPGTPVGYTLWYDLAVAWTYESVPQNPQLYGHQALMLSAYMNHAGGQVSATDIYHRFAEVIFSKQPIACPTL